MSKRHHKTISVVVVIMLIAASVFAVKLTRKNESGEKKTEVQAVKGAIRAVVSTTGMVKPQNRLEIKPSIAGRIEEILVKEGQRVKTGDVLALMSSTERAALLDAARLQSKEELNYWQQVYKVTPLMSPIDGVIIVRSVEPGQTVTTSDAILVLSDRLIVKADVDETDIGSVKVEQAATINLDAYPQIKIDARVDHISYESTVVNNVSIYEVDILPQAVPDVFRSGMSANVEIVIDEHTDVLLLPAEAVQSKNGSNTVLVKDPASGKPVEREIVIGLQDDKDIEIISGITGSDIVFSSHQPYRTTKRNSGSNPFFPAHGKSSGGQSSGKQGSR